MIAATEDNVAWLCARIYETRRTIEPELKQGEHAVFVLLTKGREDRHHVEAIFIDYFQRKYHMDIFLHAKPGVETAVMTRIELPDIASSIALIDI